MNLSYNILCGSLILGLIVNTTIVLFYSKSNNVINMNNAAITELSMQYDINDISDDLIVKTASSNEGVEIEIDEPMETIEPSPQWNTLMSINKKQIIVKEKDSMKKYAKTIDEASENEPIDVYKEFGVNWGNNRIMAQPSAAHNKRMKWIKAIAMLLNSLSLADAKALISVMPTDMLQDIKQHVTAERWHILMLTQDDNNQNI